MEETVDLVRCAREDADGAHDGVRFGIERSGALPGEAEATHQAQRVGPGLGVERDHQAVGPGHGRVERHAPVQGLDEVHVGLAQAGHELGGERGTRGAEKAVGQRDDGVDIPVRRRLELAVLLQQIPTAAADGLQQPEADVALSVGRGVDERGVDQPAQELDDIQLLLARLGEQGRGQVEVERLGDDGQAPQPALEVGRQWLVGRMEGGADAAMAVRRPTRPAEQVQLVLQRRQQLRRAEHPGAGRGELDGERHAVEPADQPGDVARHHVVRQGLRPRVGGPVEEQLDRRRDRSAVGVVVPWQLERSHREHPLAFDTQRHPAGGQHPTGRVVADEGGDERGGPDQVGLTVVDHQEHGLLVAEVLERLNGVEPELAGDDLVQRLGLGDSVQLHEPHPAGIPALLAGGHLQRQPGLADAARADQRDDGVVDQQLADQLRLACPAEERRA